MYRVLIYILALPALVKAAVHDINVGQSGALKFSPNSITGVAVGDSVEFHFFSGSGGHSVVEAAFASPCVPSTNAFFSGYIPGDSTGDQTFIINITSTDPIWFYCSLDGHCPGGMVGVINPPSGQSVTDFANAAAKVTKASAPSAAGGGVLTTIMSTSTSASSTASSTGGSSTTSSGSAATNSATGAGNKGDFNVVVGLGVVMGGLVALMA